ncbi:MAG: DinB family protein [Alphaproteobacteria bacterium]
MITPDFVREMAHYNRWQNTRVFGFCDTLSDQERRADRGMFFGSIHQTLVHIMNVDRWIMSHPLGVPGVPAAGGDHWTDIKRDRAALDDFIDRLADRAEWRSGVYERPGPDGAPPRRIPRPLFAVQLFSHQTHHRSQVTSELWKLGIDYGSTDIPFRPDAPW